MHYNMRENSDSEVFIDSMPQNLSWRKHLKEYKLCCTSLAYKFFYRCAAAIYLFGTTAASESFQNSRNAHKSARSLRFSKL